MTDSLSKRLDTFQFKGFREILGVNTTYIERKPTNGFFINQIIYEKLPKGLSNMIVNSSPQHTC